MAQGIPGVWLVLFWRIATVVSCFSTCMAELRAEQPELVIISDQPSNVAASHCKKKRFLV